MTTTRTVSIFVRDPQAATVTIPHGAQSVHVTAVEGSRPLDLEHVCTVSDNGVLSFLCREAVVVQFEIAEDVAFVVPVLPVPTPATDDDDAPAEVDHE